MKKLLFIMLVATLFSCKKNRQCYDCSFGILNGVQRPPEVWCGDPNHVFTDNSGNALNSFCRPR